jgi:hypothetical protein
MITSQVRLQPMDKWEDYPIKVLDMAPLIMVTLPTVSSFSTCGCFLRVEHSFSRMISLLFSLACVWPLGRMALCFCEWRCLQQLRVEGSSGARKGRPNRPPRVGQAGWLGPTGPGPSRPGSVAPSLPWFLMYFCTLPPPFAPFWRCHPRVQDGGSPCMKFGLLRFNPRGYSFVTLWSLPSLGVISSSS